VWLQWASASELQTCIPLPLDLFPAICTLSQTSRDRSATGARLAREEALCSTITEALCSTLMWPDQVARGQRGSGRPCPDELSACTTDSIASAIVYSLNHGCRGQWPRARSDLKTLTSGPPRPLPYEPPGKAPRPSVPKRTLHPARAAPTSPPLPSCQRPWLPGARRLTHAATAPVGPCRSLGLSAPHAVC
jgi:hypothetical protein